MSHLKTYHKKMLGKVNHDLPACQAIIGNDRSSGGACLNFENKRSSLHYEICESFIIAID